ncbi:uncharacterized protein EI90DRAFT_3050753 [Cantharellus anzutake]|uniref:uncharacterized protein n=1 Tax=Cantharellus anzutake TaxID=1750568 RepID=UPI001905E618|nr:uncharacterized protein EI90DRAFT_3050753 [Cantharellus anzutake]KAF8334030.1 hypothetical protein EI90DRAFT_3050753 [Cantharellus anzutake]
MMPDFVPAEGFNASNERDWAATLGMLDWDKTSVVFTKRELVDFLRHMGVTVDTDWRNVSKLPKYASIGRFNGFLSAENKETSSASAPSAAIPPPVQAAGGFKPSRRVRTVPGGPSTINKLFGEDDESSTFPPPKVASPPATATEPPTSDELEKNLDELSLEETERQAAFKTAFKPSRRVREIPGGQDTISQLFAGEDEGVTGSTRPSRRVRTAPGGESSGIFD